MFAILEQTQADPEHVRYVSFLLFNDIYRQLPYFKTMNRFWHGFVSLALADLRQLFDDAGVGEIAAAAKRYSEIVQKTIS